MKTYKNRYRKRWRQQKNRKERQINKTKIGMKKYKKRYIKRQRRQKNRIEQQINRNKNWYDKIKKEIQKEIKTTEKQNRTINQFKQKQA